MVSPPADARPTWPAKANTGIVAINKTIVNLILRERLDIFASS
jgi:hypothetical protein